MSGAEDAFQNRLWIDGEVVLLLPSKSSINATPSGSPVALLLIEFGFGTTCAISPSIDREDIFSVSNSKIIDQKFADNALTQLDVDRSGLDSIDRKYLNVIIEKYQGGPVGLDTLSAILSEQKDMIEEVIEPYLLQRGLIQRSSRGRFVSASGWRHLGLSPPKNAEEQSDMMNIEKWFWIMFVKWKLIFKILKVSSKKIDIIM